MRREKTVAEPGEAAALEDEAAASTEELSKEQLEDVMAADWSRMQAGLRERRAAAAGRAHGKAEEDGEDDEDDEDLDEDDPRHTRRRRMRPDDEVHEGMSMRTCCLIFVATLALLALVAGGAYAHWRYPSPLGCSVGLVRPQKFKIDVTNFWSPHVSAAVQLVLSVKNGNLLRALLLDGLTVSVYEAATGLKLGSANQGSLVIGAMTSTQVTLAVTRLGGSLPDGEQRRLASEFLSHKALLLTFVVTATSRLPIKGSKVSQTSTNTTRRVDLSGLYKDPFFQRAPAPAPPADATAKDKVHDVPL